jgi:hypothetical protein
MPVLTNENEFLDSETMIDQISWFNEKALEAFSAANKKISAAEAEEAQCVLWDAIDFSNNAAAQTTASQAGLAMNDASFAVYNAKDDSLAQAAEWTVLAADAYNAQLILEEVYDKLTVAYHAAVASLKTDETTDNG